jgi:hypothetical protein
MPDIDLRPILATLNMAEPKAIARLLAKGSPDDAYYRVLGYLRELARYGTQHLSNGPDIDSWSPAMVAQALEEVNVVSNTSD